MSLKSGIIILVLSVVVTIGFTVLGFVTNQYQIANGIPLAFTEFSFLGSATNYLNFILDIIFWFGLIFGIWKLIPKLLNK